MDPDESIDRRVVVLAPTPRDGAATAALLTDAGLAAVAHADFGEAIADVTRGAAAFLLPEEALDADRLAQVTAFLARQPPWSDLPILLLTYAGADSAAARDATRRLGNVTLLERPLRAGTLISALRTALRARERQYQIRGHLAERAQVEAALRDSEERHAFILKLSDALRSIADPAQVQAVAMRVLGEHLGANRAQYWEADADGDHFASAGGFAHGVSLVTGRARIGDFGAHLKAVLAAGQTLAVADAADDPRVGPSELAAYDAFGFRAHLGIPLVKAGRLVAVLGVYRAGPHAWTAGEITVAEETAERTWAAVERARAEAALAASQERFREELEARVRERTADLARANASLEAEIGERRAAERQIKALHERLVATQEEERRRIARDIHDQLGQHMTALRMRLEAIVPWVSDDPARKDQAVQTQQLAEELDRSIDFLTSQLRPAALDHFGLPAALRNLVASWSDRFAIPAEFTVSGRLPGRLREDAETNLYRLTQEALHNIVKHAGAHYVSVRLRHRAGQIVLAIADDGQGFDLAEAQQDPAAGLGLVSMRERAILIGGTLEIDAAPGRGTTLLVRIPAGVAAQDAPQRA
jgi:signal transduction histidine kinase/FixJ family two-component response regulator